MTIEFDIDKIVEAIMLAMDKQQEQNYHDYIRIMAEIGWPAYLDGDFDFHERIIKFYENKLFDKIEEAIYTHYNDIYIDELQERLEKSLIIKNARNHIFKEAFLLYKLGYYYGCVASLMTQVIGVIKDIENYFIQNGAAYAEKNIKLLSSRYKVSENSEKGKLIATLLEGKDLNDEQGEYWYLIGYFRNKIFRDKLDDCELSTQVNRNMIFHSNQLSFGSKEQALKLIICIDSLCWISEVIYDKLNE